MIQDNFLEHLSVLDGFCLFIVFSSALYGLLRGFSREIISLILWFLAALLSMRGSSFIFSQVSFHKITPLYSVGVPFFIFIILMVILNFIARPISHFGRDILSPNLDAVLGALFGILRGYIIIIVLALFFSWSAEDWFKEGLQNALFAPYIQSGMDFIGGSFAYYFPNHFSLEEHL